MTDADRIAELEEEVAYYKSELGLAVQGETRERLRRSFRISKGAAAVLSMLWGAKGRMLSQSQMMEALPPVTRSEDSDESRILAQYVLQIRRGLGSNDTLLCSGERRYGLSDGGLALCARVLGAGAPAEPMDYVEASDTLEAALAASTRDSEPVLRSFIALAVGRLADLAGEPSARRVLGNLMRALDKAEAPAIRLRSAA